MRTIVGVAAALALVACSKSSDKPKPDLGKMSTTEACRVIAKRAFECKDKIVGAISADLKKHGAPDDVIARMTQQMSQPLPCDHVSASDIDPMITCYDDDCDKLATCFVAMTEDATRSGGPSDSAPTQPKSADTPSSVSASGSN